MEKPLEDSESLGFYTTPFPYKYHYTKPYNSTWTLTFAFALTKCTHGVQSLKQGFVHVAYCFSMNSVIPLFRKYTPYMYAVHHVSDFMSYEKTDVAFFLNCNKF